MFDCNTKELKKEIDDLTKTVESLEKQLNQEIVRNSTDPSDFSNFSRSFELETRFLNSCIRPKVKIKI